MAADPREHGAVWAPDRAAAERERGAVRQLVRDHAAFVGRSLRYLGVREEDLEDVAQDVFVVVYRRLSDFEGRSSLRTWLYGICVRLALAYRRKAATRRELAMAEPPEPAVPATQHALLQRKEARERLQRVLDELDLHKRTVFVLYEIERMPMKEVAEAVGCPLQTAYSRHQAARKQVLAAFERYRKQDDS